MVYQFWLFFTVYNFNYTNKKIEHLVLATTYFRPKTIIGSVRLNFSVRNGKRCFPYDRSPTLNVRFSDCLSSSFKHSSIKGTLYSVPHSPHFLLHTRDPSRTQTRNLHTVSVTLCQLSYGTRNRGHASQHTYSIIRKMNFFTSSKRIMLAPWFV